MLVYNIMFKSNKDFKYSKTIFVLIWLSIEKIEWKCLPHNIIIFNTLYSHNIEVQCIFIFNSIIKSLHKYIICW